MKKRKVLVCFLTVALVLSLSVSTVFATTSTEELTTNPGNIYGKSAQELLSGAVSSKGIITPRVELLSINLNISPYVQTDSRWSSDIMQDEGLPIGTHGCALTSTAMLAKTMAILQKILEHLIQV